MITALDQHSSEIRATKQGVMVFSHALEDMLASRGFETSAGVVIALFQRRTYFDHEADRYARLAAAGSTVVVAFVGPVDGLPDGVHGVQLEADSPLATQWALLVLNDHLGAALLVTQTGRIGAGPSTLDASRMFAGGWTFDRGSSAAAARQLLDELGSGVDSETRARALAVIGDATAGPVDPALVVVTTPELFTYVPGSALVTVTGAPFVAIADVADISTSTGVRYRRWAHPRPSARPKCSAGNGSWTRSNGLSREPWTARGDWSLWKARPGSARPTLPTLRWNGLDLPERPSLPSW